MPTDFKNKKNTNSQGRNKQPVNSQSPDQNSNREQPSVQTNSGVTNNESGPRAGTEAINTENTPITSTDIVLSGLSLSDKAQVAAIREKVQATNLIVNSMFSTDDNYAGIDLQIMNGLTITARLLSNKDLENLDEYSSARDPFSLYKDEDDREIKDIMSASAANGDDMNYAMAKELYLRTFPKQVAVFRYSKVAASLAIVRINKKSTGRDLHQRFDTISGLPALIVQKMCFVLDLLERAVKLELLDENTVKN